MLSKQLFYLSILITFANVVNAQSSVSGKIVDIENNSIPYANIVLLNLKNNEFIIGTITNTEGKFSLTYTEKCKCRLKISFIGFNDTIIDLNDQQKTELDDIVLTTSSTNLKEITVTSKQSLITQNEDKIILNIQSSPMKEGYNGIEVLQRTPYLWVDSRNNILMRNETATVLINGKKLSLQGSDLANYLMTLDSENIKSIEIQTSNGVNTDAESSGGIINIILKKRPLGFNSQLKTYYTLKGKDLFTFYTGGNFNYGADKFNTYGKYEFISSTTSSFSESDIKYTQTKNQLNTKRILKNKLDRHNYQFGITTLLWKKHEIGFEFFGSQTQRYNNGSGNIILKSNTLVIDSAILNNFNENKNYLTNGVINYTWNIDTNQSKLNLYVDYSKQEITNVNQNSSIYDLNVFNDTKEKNNSLAKTETYAIQTDYNKNYNHNLKLKIGLKFTTTKRENGLSSEYFNGNSYVFDSLRTTLYNYFETLSAGYVSVSKKIKKKNYFKAGLRIENTDTQRQDLLISSTLNQNYTGLFPSFYYSRKLKKDKLLSASYSRSLRRPSFTLLNNTITKVNDFRFILGNSDLKPELVNKYEISYLFKGQSFSIYHNKTNNAINGTYFLEGDIAYYKKYNSGSQIQYGIDYNISKKIIKWWYLKFSGNVFYRSFINYQDVEMFAKTTLYVNIYSNFKLNETTSFDVSSYYMSPKSDAFYQANEKYKIDFIIKKSFFSKRLNTRIYINDIFNTLEYGNVREFDDYITTALEKPNTRSITFWLTYSFSNKHKLKNKKNISKNDANNRL